MLWRSGAPSASEIFLPDVAAHFHIQCGAAAAAPRAYSARGCRSAAAGQTTSGKVINLQSEKGEAEVTREARGAQQCAMTRALRARPPEPEI